MTDPLALGQRVVAILQMGRRTATYKLATLMALMDQCLERLPDDPQAELVVPVRELAERVLEIYWHQVLPFEGELLKQTTQPIAAILREAVRLRAVSNVGDRRVALAVARLRAPTDYATVVTAIGLTLVRQPLPRLQRIGPGPSPSFLYDDSWMHDNISPAQLAAHGGAFELYPGVAWSLTRLSGLLKPALEVLWVDDVRRWNKGLVAHVPDIAGHLFGRDRVSLAPARAALLDAFGAECFYCAASVGASAPVDHVLPWSRVGIDGLANLVVACRRCNGNKSQSLPAPWLVERVVARDETVMEQVAVQLRWPTQLDRVVAAARGLYRGQAAGTPLWTAFGQTAAVDIAWSPDWLLDLTGAYSDSHGALFN